MKNIFLSLALLLSSPLSSQDSITIFVGHPGVEEGWKSEYITFSKDNVLFGKLHCNYSRMIKFNANRYKAFHKYLVKTITPKLIASISRYQKKHKKSYYDCERKFDLGIYIYKGKESTYYKLKIFNNCNVSLQSEQLFKPFLDFVDNFMQEHGCEETYTTHTVKKGETLASIAEAYGTDEVVIWLYCGLFQEVYNRINKRKADSDVDIDIDKKDALAPGLKLIMPCYPVKISKFE